MADPTENRTAQNVVIIGGGIAGLTAAAYLARAGLPVTVFEHHQLPGGYVSSFHRNGFCFPAGLTSFCSNGIVFPILKELGIEEKRPFERVYRQVSWDGTDVPLRERGQMERQLAGLFPEDGSRLRSYFRLVAEGERWMQAFERSNIYLDARRPRMLSLFPALPFQPPH
jgi:phytoene dehydrogenase-like protein